MPPGASGGTLLYLESPVYRLCMLFVDLILPALKEVITTVLQKLATNILRKIP